MSKPKNTPSNPVPADLTAHLKLNVLKTLEAVEKTSLLAVATGFMALAAKSYVPHGEFGEWLRGQFFADLDDRKFQARWVTVNRWMLLARAVQAQIKHMFNLADGPDGVSYLATVLLSEPGELSEEEAEWKAAVVNLLNGFSARELVMELRTREDAGNPQKHTPSERNGQMTFDDVKRGWANLTTQITTLGHIDQSWADLPDEMAWEFLDAAVPVVRNLSTTKPLTKAQRERLLAELVTITTALRAAK